MAHNAEDMDEMKAQLAAAAAEIQKLKDDNHLEEDKERRHAIEEARKAEKKLLAARLRCEEGLRCIEQAKKDSSVVLSAKTALQEAIVKFENIMAEHVRENEEKRYVLEMQRIQLNHARREFEIDVARELANRRARQDANRWRHHLPNSLSLHTAAFEYNEGDDSSEDDCDW
ncbi:hypothetical protein QBC34DRAFT_375415 [Podospora aff. communis PSN243]|uniref:Uncharacterized protein n=1 Tax=Podospora aff. communis PSN243 TaxID=3040156 RepID=A0AAV9H3Z1_9PEZI|nr:hypothetical protein QBC34DRAFT_375415 [Podospora aff. communis PSN243]